MCEFQCIFLCMLWTYVNKTIYIWEHFTCFETTKACCTINVQILKHFQNRYKHFQICSHLQKMTPNRINALKEQLIIQVTPQIHFQNISSFNHFEQHIFQKTKVWTNQCFMLALMTLFNFKKSYISHLQFIICSSMSLTSSVHVIHIVPLMC